MAEIDYLRNPEEIYRQSFETIIQEADLSRFDGPVRKLVIRLIHACGMPDIVDQIRFSADFAEIAGNAYFSGAPIFADVESVASGIIKRRLMAGNEIICKLSDPGVEVHARKIGNTRTAAAVDFWGDQLNGAIVAIGNAPTALFRLMETIENGGIKPAVVLAFPVGFVGAAESKQKLADGGSKTAFLTLLGRRGGSALASAAVNALADFKSGDSCPNIG